MNHTGKLFTCECCGYVAVPASFEFCGFCDWQADTAQNDDPDLTGGANGISLREAQEYVRSHGKAGPSPSWPPPPNDRYPRDPAWRPVADAKDLSESPAQAREAFEGLRLEDEWWFTGGSRHPADPGALAPIVAERLAREGWQVVERPWGDQKERRHLSCSAGDARFDVEIQGAPHVLLSTGVKRQVLTGFGPERWGECFLQISELLNLDVARSSPAMATVSDLDESEWQGGPVAFVDWIQYWSAPIVTRWGLETLTRGPFARVEARGAGAAAVWLVRDPFIEPMSRARAAAFLGLPLRNICRKDYAASEWLSIPWP